MNVSLRCGSPTELETGAGFVVGTSEASEFIDDRLGPATYYAYRIITSDGMGTEAASRILLVRTAAEP